MLMLLRGAMNFSNDHNSAVPEGSKVGDKGSFFVLNTDKNVFYGSTCICKCKTH